MASFQKYGKRWRVFVKRKGVSKTAIFDTKREAQDWASRMEASIVDGSVRAASKRTFREALLRYHDDVSSRKRGWYTEQYALMRIVDVLGDVMLSDLDEAVFSAYRDERLKSVKPSTVKRELNLLSHVCTVAVKEWKWLDRNPVTDVRKPADSAPRNRRVSDDEIERLKLAAGYGTLKSVQSRVIHAFLFAIETAMRAGEIKGLTWKDVDLEKRTAFLPMTKNGSARTVPLSSRAVELLRMLPVEGESVFRLSQMTQSFIDVRKRAGIDDLHFHDSRHEAITRLSKKLDVLALARMVGHRNIQQLMTYYNESPEDIAKKLS